LGFSISAPGKDWILVKVYTQDGIRWDTLFYQKKGSVIRGQGLIEKSPSTSLDSAQQSLGKQSYTAACSEFSIGTWILITNPVNQRKLVVQIDKKIAAAPKTKGMRLSLAAEPAALLRFEKEAVNQIRVQQIDTLYTSTAVPKDTSLQVLAPDSTVLMDPVSGYYFKKSGKSIKGIASFYSVGLDGTLTATGEKFRNEKLTAASNNLPLNTWVLVTNTKNGKTVVLRTNDRMHPRMAKKGRVVDLSIRAARQLDFVKDGLTKVKVEVLSIAQPPEKDSTSLPAPKGKQTVDLPVTDSSFTGISTIYPNAYKGKKTRSGEKYQPNLMTAACNQVPLQTRIRVYSTSSEKWVEVWVNDRLPAAADKDVVLQLSDQAAKMLNFLPQKRYLVRVLPLLSPPKNK
ncbi:MAG: septal ring lytic transglycosylase RlpA family protein, partial [Sediminibacterium sp.]|nr:septal ring lytic transglycosylase RlpA family protein [Sediminibacterium sp.]